MKEFVNLQKIDYTLTNIIGHITLTRGRMQNQIIVIYTLLITVIPVLPASIRPALGNLVFPQALGITTQ